MDLRKRLGYWFSDRKAKKLSMNDVLEELSALNIEAVKIELTVPLSQQGPFDIILHKLTDLIAEADLGNTQAQSLLKNVETYVAANPHVIVIDQIEFIRTVIDRYKTYSIINEFVTSDDVFVPPFVVLDSNNHDKNIDLLRCSKASFPLVSKPITAHGSRSAHEVGIQVKSSTCNPHVMTLVFNEDGLRECIFPCVVQSFVNHDGVLYKLFVLGNKYVLVERPSIRNLTASQDMKPIHFHSGDVSKPSSCSQLTFREAFDTLGDNRLPCHHTLNHIVMRIRKVLRLGLFGVDVVVDNRTGRHAIIDVNSFPGYDGLTNFPGHLASFVFSMLYPRGDKDDAVQLIDADSNFVV